MYQVKSFCKSPGSYKSKSKGQTWSIRFERFNVTFNQVRLSVKIILNLINSNKIWEEKTITCPLKSLISKMKHAIDLVRHKVRNLCALLLLIKRHLFLKRNSRYGMLKPIWMLPFLNLVKDQWGGDKIFLV